MKKIILIPYQQKEVAVHKVADVCNKQKKIMINASTRASHRFVGDSHHKQ